MMAEKDIRRSKVYAEGVKFVYDDGELPEGLNAAVGSVLCLQRRHGISATQMPGTADDWLVIGGGSGEGGGCNCGFTPSLKAKLNDMPTIKWKGNNVITVNGTDYVLTPASSPTPAQYTLTVTSANTSMGTVTGGGSYASGATATLTATAKTGYHFVQWSDGNKEASRTVTVTGNKTYTATFAADSASGADYMVGWANGTKSEFNALTDAELANMTTSHSTATDSTYEHAFGDKQIFYLLYKSTAAPKTVNLISAGQTMAQNLESDNSFAGHADVTVAGTAYKLFGIRLASTYDPTDTIQLIF